jgi:hypothetical protein
MNMVKLCLLDLVFEMLEYNQTRRPNALRALSHVFSGASPTAASCADKRLQESGGRESD